MKEESLLTADWKHLSLLNWIVDRELLEPYLPSGTELDLYNGKAYLSLVGLQFLNSRVYDIAIPLAQEFEQVNLRFYVKRKETNEWRHGVVFIREIVSNSAVAAAGRWIFNENYLRLPMEHGVHLNEPPPEPKYVDYAWTTDKRKNFMRVVVKSGLQSIQPNSVQEFLAMRFWGYTALPKNQTAEFRVEHPRWNEWRGESYLLECDIAELFGTEFVPWLTLIPNTYFVLDGSNVTMFKRHKI